MPRISFLDRLCDAVGPISLAYFRSEMAIENKLGEEGFDPVTQADKEIETSLRKMIENEFPKDGILGEEFGEKIGSSGWRWIIDPIDGTRSYITGRPTWGILIALQHEGYSVAGVMDQPFTGERFIAREGIATLQHQGEIKELKVRGCVSLEKAIIHTTAPHNIGHLGRRKKVEEIISSSKMARVTQDGYTWCMLAFGGIDAVVDHWNLMPYDIQPMIPIIEAAGGIITHWDGREVRGGGRILAAGDRRVHQQLLDLLSGEDL